MKIIDNLSEDGAARKIKKVRFLFAQRPISSGLALALPSMMMKRRRMKLKRRMKRRRKRRRRMRKNYKLQLFTTREAYFHQK